MLFVILPVHLFKNLPKKYSYILWEHPHYFKSYTYNKKKILLHQESCRKYAKKLGIKLIRYNEPFEPKEHYFLFDPIDNIELPGSYTMIDNPGFLLNQNLIKEYRKKTDKFFFNAFYNWGKKQIGIIPDIKSRDKYNRKTIPKDTKFPKVKAKELTETTKELKNFESNYGNTENFIYPTTHPEAKKLLEDFIKNKLENFGKYQDAIIENESFLFHSLLSSSINIGLITPNDIVKRFKKIKVTKENINSYEGFIRQLFWREYQRYCNEYINFKDFSYFNLNKKLSKDWYQGTTNNSVVNRVIKRAFDTGYLHHIERLMVIGNYMTLSGIKPSEGFRWFMEFSVDSYEWVMYQNVYDMVFFVTGGKTTRRPYNSSSNYILKMSNYPQGDWVNDWDEKYNDFIKSNKKQLKRFKFYFRNLKVL